FSVLGFTRATPPPAEPPEPAATPKIGLALGGGFARGAAHAGVLAAFERHGVPIHCITGVSAGSIVAAAYASGATPEEIARAGCAMRFGDVARWSLCRMGFVVSERMKRFLERAGAGREQGADQCVSGGEPVLPDHADAHGGFVAARERPVRRTGS